MDSHTRQPALRTLPPTLIPAEVVARLACISAASSIAGCWVEPAGPRLVLSPELVHITSHYARDFGEGNRTYPQAVLQVVFALVAGGDLDGRAGLLEEGDGGGDGAGGGGGDGCGCGEGRDEEDEGGCEVHCW